MNTRWPQRISTRGNTFLLSACIEQRGFDLNEQIYFFCSDFDVWLNLSIALQIFIARWTRICLKSTVQDFTMLSQKPSKPWLLNLTGWLCRGKNLIKFASIFIVIEPINVKIIGQTTVLKYGIWNTHHTLKKWFPDLQKVQSKHLFGQRANYFQQGCTVLLLNMTWSPFHPKLVMQSHQVLLGVWRSTKTTHIWRQVRLKILL